MKKKLLRGRPRRAKKSSTARLVARCTQSELEAAEAAAAWHGETLAEFVRAAVAKEVLAQERLRAQGRAT